MTSWLRVLLLAVISVFLGPSRASTPRDLPSGSPVPVPVLMMPVFELPPWAYFDADCKARGVAVDVLGEIAAGAGLQLRYRPETQPALPGEVQFVLSAIERREGQSPLAGRPAFALDNIVVPSRSNRFADLTEIRGQRIGFDRDELRMRNALVQAGADVVSFANYEEMVDALRRDTVAGVAGLREPLVYLLHDRAEGRTLMARSIPLEAPNVWLHLDNNASPEWRSALTRSAQAFIRSGRYATLRDRYLSSALRKREVTRMDCPLETP